ncbi:chemotaxis protein CheW [Chitinibacter sp. ZOR0017]|uniref:chemotaxis protein CheW n=1 Tax=Chitinibacter sp. ZOR0017 TaxID=1339254 RepID=UPI0006470D40|nr:chemotaxis protein CheW [Chitinibacter sp. ZOR0017]
MNNELERVFGVFLLNEMQLALPLQALREVTPCLGLREYPSAARGIIGAIDLRGALIPVLDLRRVLGLSTPELPAQSVVIMAHEGQLIGLLAHGVQGVFQPEGRDFQPVSAQTGQLHLLAGSFQRRDVAALVSVLDPAALSRLPDLPMVLPAETVAGLGEGRAAELSYVMLMRCGGVPLAMPSDAVFTTILTPNIDRDSALASGFCLGVLEHAGSSIPAVDLYRMLGLNSQLRHANQQAFLVQFPAGLVAFLVDEINDVVPTYDLSLAPIPAHSFAQQRYLAGVLDSRQLPEHNTSVQTRALGYYLMLDVAALQAAADLQGLGRMNMRSEGEIGLAGSRQQRPTCQMLTYDLCAEVGTPIEQIVEILPWQHQEQMMGGGDYAGGLVVHRGRAIATYSLAQVLGLEPPTLTPTASVLVVECGDTLIGFGVARLMSIDEAEWPPQDGHAFESGHQRLHANPQAQNWKSVMAGQGSQTRLLSVLDLRELAEQLMAR